MNKKIIAALLLSMTGFHFCEAQNIIETKPEKYIAPWFVEKFRVSAGFFVPINDARVQVGLTNGDKGTVINLEEDLGFKKPLGTFVGNFQYRLKRRSRFDLTYFRVNRKASSTLKKDIDFGENTYPVNADVNFFFKTTIYRFSYGYALIQKPRYEAGLLIGTHIVQTKVGLSLKGSANSVSKSDVFGFTAPWPDIGIWGGCTFSDRFAFTGEVDYFYLKAGNTNGSLIGGSCAFLYHAGRQFDVSLSYIGLNFDVSAKKTRLEGNLRWGYNGPALSATYSFGKKYWVHKN